MAYIPLEKLLKSAGGLYQLAMGAARRATELNQGAAPLIESSSKKIATIALEEIADQKVRFEWDKSILKEKDAEKEA